MMCDLLLSVLATMFCRPPFDFNVAEWMSAKRPLALGNLSPRTTLPAGIFQSATSSVSMLP